MNDARAARAETIPTAGAEGSAEVVAEAPRWPGAIPGAAEAEAAVAGAVGAPVADAAAVVTRVAAELSEIERSAFDGLALADLAILKSAAGLRLRLATALESAPVGGEIDPDAVQELLSSADAILAALAQEAGGATDQVAAAIGSIRTDLVRDAIRVSETHQRLANPQGASVSPVAGPASPQVRLLSNESDDVPAVRERSRRNVGLWVALAIAALLAGGYHVNRAYEMQKATASMIRVDGAPERVIASSERSSGQVLYTPPGAPLTAPELQQLRAVQQKRGRAVVERTPGVYVIQRIAAQPGR